MLSRLGPADSVVAGQRIARVDQRQRRRPLLPPSVPSVPGGDVHSSQTGQGYQALPSPQRGPAADSDSAEATWSADAHAQASAQPTFPFRVEHIAEAYRATDPVQPRPGLYLHVRA